MVTLSYVKLVGVSRSGYYHYFSEEAVGKSEARSEQMKRVKEIILKAYHFRRRKKGARQIKMTLENQYQITYNLKRIRRIMKNLVSFVRFEKRILIDEWQKQQRNIGHVPNLLNRQFKQGIAGKVLLTDITYLSYGKGKRAYLSTIKDAETNEILAYEVSDKITLDIALNTLKKLKKNRV